MRRIANEILGVKGSMMKLSCRVGSLETELLSGSCFYRNCTFSSCLLFLLKLIRKKSRQGCTMILSGTGHYLLLGEKEGGEWVVCRRGGGLCVGEYLISPKDSVIFLCSLLYNPPLKFCWRLLIPPPFPLETM